MAIRERIRDDLYLSFFLFQVGVTVVGGLILFLFMTMAAPSLTYIWTTLFSRGFVVALFGGVFALLYNREYDAAVRTVSGLLSSGQPLGDSDLKKAREAALNFPKRLLTLTIILWPGGVAAIAFWLWASGILRIEDAARVTMTGLLYSPIHGLIFFFATRYFMRIMGERIKESGYDWFRNLHPGYTIRQKMIATFATLAIVPLITGVLITDVQEDKTRLRYNLGAVCQTLEKIHATAGKKSTPESWAVGIRMAKYISDLPPGTLFMVSDDKAHVIAGDFGAFSKAKKLWIGRIREGGEAGVCYKEPLPGEQHFLVMRFFTDPGVWVCAVCDPIPRKLNFWSTYGITVALALIMAGIAVALGYFMARDVGDPLEDLTEFAARVTMGEDIRVQSFIPDDELSDLALNFNTLVDSFHGEIERSKTIVGQVKEIITGLGELAYNLQQFSMKQRNVIDEHTSLSKQAGSSAGRVTMTASEIKDRAHHTQYQMEETSASARESDLLIKEVSQLIEAMAGDSENIWQEMQTLEQNYRRMEEVVRIIDDISERTEILALNATLEAGGSKTADAGDRFAVVAGEVQRLSERISEQIGDIKKLFKDIRRSSMAMAQSIDVGRSRAGDAPRWIKRLGNTLQAIDERAEATAASMSDIVRMTEDQGEALEQMKFIVSEIQSIATVIDEVTAGAETAMIMLNDNTDRLRDIIEDE